MRILFLIKAFEESYGSKRACEKTIYSGALRGSLKASIASGCPISSGVSSSAEGGDWITPTNARSQLTRVR